MGGNIKIYATRETDQVGLEKTQTYVYMCICGPLTDEKEVTNRV